jgi:hypothetical protein
VASNLNHPAGDTIANNTITKLSATGSVCIFTFAATQLLLDVNGYLPATSTVGTLPPQRVLDTRAPNSTVDGVSAGGGPRAAGSVTQVQITGRGGVPVGATAVIATLTAVDTQGAGFATAFDCSSSPPVASNLNHPAGDTIANNTITKLSASGSVCIFTFAATQLLLDVNGFAT